MMHQVSWKPVRFPNCSCNAREPHYYKNFPHRGRTEPVANIHEASTMGDVARNVPRINATLEDHQEDYQSSMVELEGKISDHLVSILIYPGASLSYVSPRIVDECHLKS